MSDNFVSRSGDDYAEALAALLPTGRAWPRDRGSVLMRVVSGLAQIWGRVDARAAALLQRESDPRQTIELLPDWERAFGLPDECVGPVASTDERRVRLVQRMTEEGGQSRDYFVALAAQLGYRITIEELAPIMGGVSRGGDIAWEAGPPEIRCWWIVHVYGQPIWWFRGGVGEGGKDHHAEWTGLIALECLIRRYKPAHTQVTFNYLDPTLQGRDA
ncbi:MAG: YmfQ family protein [Pseudolabrys sp.]